MISIIVPVYNEELILSQQRQFFEQLSKSAELIFVDGGSNDNTVQSIGSLGKVLTGKKGRALQMNVGAEIACNDILLFLHADTHFDLDSLEAIEQAICHDGYVGGCLNQIIDAPGLLFRWIAWTGNIRAKVFRVFYGDQGIFVRKDIFWSLGGFPDVSLAEDVLFTSRLRRGNKVGILPCSIYCSPRRWDRQGILKTFLLNIRISLGLMFSVDTEQLARRYKDVR